MKTKLILSGTISEKIVFIRNHKILLDRDLARLYGVETRVFNQAVKRNICRFPEDFMFRLNNKEADRLVSQNVIPHRKYFGGSLPYAFTEQGVAMLSSILRSERAIQVNIAIMRTFVKLRGMFSTHKELIHRLNQLEQKATKHDMEIQTIFEAIRQLMSPPGKPKRRIGFNAD